MTPTCAGPHFAVKPEAKFLAVKPCPKPVALCSECSFVVFLGGGHIVPLPPSITYLPPLVDRSEVWRRF